MSVLTKIEISTSFIYIEEDILVLKWKEDAEIDLDACKEIVALRKQHQQDKNSLLLIDQRQFWNITNQAKAYSKQKEIEGMNRAVALLTGDSLPSIMVANAYIKLYRPNVPMKVFKSEEKARSWLLKYK